MSELAATEIKALVRIMDELDYYQLMHVQRGVNSRELKRAYYQTTRTFHPDANRHLGDDLRGAVAQISKRVSEAYAVLRDPKRRQAYDRMLDAGSQVRIRLTDSPEASGAPSENAATTAQGRQYWNLAQSDLSRGDHASAARNLQMALTFEPGNAALKEALDAAKQGA